MILIMYDERCGLNRPRRACEVDRHEGQTAMSLIERSGEIETIGDDGYRRIRSDIVLARLRPGQKLKLEGLRETYGVSVSTLREILSRLTAEGLVTAEGRRGFEVAPVSVSNLKELAELRLLLECHALEASFARPDMEWEGRVVSAHHKLASTERLMESGIGEPEQWKRYDSEFHQALISNCGSRADGSARRGVRSVFPLSDDRTELPRGGARFAAQGPARLRAQPRRRKSARGARRACEQLRRTCIGHKCIGVIGVRDRRRRSFQPLAGLSRSNRHAAALGDAHS